MSKPISRDYNWKGNAGITFRRQTGTAASGALTKQGRRVQATSEALTTAAAATYTLTLTNSLIKADSLVLAAVKYGTATAGVPVITRITPAAGSVAIVVQNNHASAAFDGTIVIDVMIIPNSLP